jgi:ElaB/YqjD/DUF883 family membrane-anchored ribosome-binding protein
MTPPFDDAELEPGDAKRQALQKAIADRQRQLEQNWQALQQQVRRQTNVGQPVQRHPYAALLGGFAVGLLLGVAR